MIAELNNDFGKDGDIEKYDKNAMKDLEEYCSGLRDECDKHISTIDKLKIQYEDKETSFQACFNINLRLL